MKSNIILSGGWGYGNLGDDAILLSSIKLVQEKKPNHNIFVITNNPIEVYPILMEHPNLHLIESIYKNIFGDKRTIYPSVKNLLRQNISKKSITFLKRIKIK